MDPQTQSDPLMRALAQRVAEMNAQGGGTMTTPGMLDPSAIGRSGEVEPRNSAYALPNSDDIVPMLRSLQGASPVASQAPAMMAAIAHSLPLSRARPPGVAPSDVADLMKTAQREKELEGLMAMQRSAEAYPFPPGVGFEGTRLAEREALARFLASYGRRPFNEGSMHGARDAGGRVVSPWDLTGHGGPVPPVR
jgi:hypothetical protein